MTVVTVDISAYWVIFSLTGCFFALALTRYSADMVLMGGVSLLLLLGIITPAEAFSGFSNQGVITVALLFVVARGLSQTGAAAWMAGGLMGRPTNISWAQFRLMLPVATLSSMVNNTPVVAMMVPAVIDWAKRHRFPISQLMMPLSYAAIIGGACSLIGTSTNLVVDGMLKSYYQSHSTPLSGGYQLGLFELAWVGLPCVVVTLLYVLFFSRWLLPKSSSERDNQYGDARQYTVEMLVEESGPLVGKSVEEAGLRSLPAVFLIEIQRAGHLITAVGPAQLLRGGDRLIFAGNVESVVDLQKMRGIRPADNQIFKLESDRSQRHLVEVVISNHFPQVGKTVKAGRFRSTYGAAIIAVAREGQRIRGRIGDIVLKPGDTLLIEAGRSFERQQRYVKDFLLVRKIDDYSPVSHRRMPLAIAIFVAMIVFAASGLLSMLEAAILAAGAMIVSRCTSAEEARRSVDWQILIVIAAAIALGVALEKTGAATAIAVQFIGAVGHSPQWALAAVFILTALFSALISNVSAAVLIFPVAAAVSAELGISLIPVAITLMIAASASFSTPIGYQTNLMVYGPGKYRFVDFLKMGLPLTVLVGITTVLLVPLIWPL